MLQFANNCRKASQLRCYLRESHLNPMDFLVIGTSHGRNGAGVLTQYIAYDSKNGMELNYYTIYRAYVLFMLFGGPAQASRAVAEVGPETQYARVLRQLAYAKHQLGSPAVTLGKLPF